MYSRLIRRAGLVLVAAAIATAAVAVVSSGRSFPFITPLLAPPGLSEVADGDSTLLFQPHDGSFESGYGFATDEEMEFVQFFIFPSENGRLLAFEACFVSLAAAVPNFQYSFEYFSVSAGGEEAEPGTRRESVDSPLFTVEAGVPSCGVINFAPDPGDPGIDISELAAYLGVEWVGEDFPTVLLAVGTNGPTSTNGWGRINDLIPDWLLLGLTPPFTDYRNLGIRTVWVGANPELPEIFDDDFESEDTSNWTETVP